MADLFVRLLWLICLLRILSPAVVLKRLGFREMTLLTFKISVSVRKNVEWLKN